MSSSSSGTRLADLGLRSFVSQSGLANILKDLKETGLPDAVSRRSIKRARASAVRLTTANGPIFRKWIIPRVDADQQPLVLEFIDPLSWLTYISDNCAGFSAFMAGCLAQHPISLEAPWQVALYVDEVAPGNQLKHDNRRKVQAIYWSFKQFGSTNLSCETNWMVLTTVRSKQVNSIGGMSVFFKYIMDSFFGDGRFAAGLPIRCQGSSYILCAKLGLVIADESALKSLFDNKGASGAMICMLCRNCVLPRLKLHEHDSTGFLISHTNHDFSKFLPATDDSIKSSINMLAARKDMLNKGQFEKLEYSVGFNHNPQGILASAWFPGHLSSSMVMFDWMHCFLVSGVYSLEVGLLLGVLSTFGISNKDIHQWFQTVRWPASIEHRGVTGKTCFEKRSGSANDHFKCSASEGLATYSPLRLFLMTQVSNRPDATAEVKQSCKSYFALAKVLDMLHSLLKGIVVEPTQLHDAVSTHMKLFTQTYDAEYVIPKFHYGLHLPTLLQKHGMLVSCFVHERKHREIKRFANQLTNTGCDFESSILECVAAAHLLDLSDMEHSVETDALIKPQPAPPDLRALMISAVGNDAEIQYSKEAQFKKGERCFSNDLVVLDLADGKHVAEIWFHISADNVPMSVVSLCTVMGGNMFKKTTEPLLVLTSAVSYVCTYVSQGDRFLVAPATVR